MTHPETTSRTVEAFATRDGLAGLAGQKWKRYIQCPGSRRAYVIAVGAVLAVLALNTLVSVLVPMPPLVLLMPALLLSGLFCGAGPTIAAALVGLIVTSAFQAPVGFPAAMPVPQRMARALLFTFMSGLLIWITSTLRRALAEAESARLKIDAALGQGSVGAWELDPVTCMVRASASAHALFGLPYTGRALHVDTWLSLISPEDAAGIREGFRAAAPDQRNFSAEYRLSSKDRPDRWIMSRAGMLVSEGRLRLVGALIDVTDRHLAEERFRETTALLSAIVETAPAMIYAKDVKGRMLLANRRALGVIGKPWEEIEGRTDLEFLPDPVQAAAVVANDTRLMQAGQAVQFEELVGQDDVSARVWSSAKALLHDGGGSVVGLVGVSIEITEQKRVEARLRLMVDELNHRVKNTLGVVQAIAVKTLTGSNPATREVLVGRLVGLAAVHDLLTRESWEGVNLEDVVAVVLAPHGGLEDQRFRVCGPKLRLNPKAAQSLSMGLHELATNALKHGAMSKPEGTIAIEWVITQDASPRLRLTWTERAGPMVTPPLRKGFGSWLMQRGLPDDLAGTVQLDFNDPSGLVCVIDAPLSEVAASRIALLPNVARQARRS